MLKSIFLTVFKNHKDLLNKYYVINPFIIMNQILFTLNLFYFDHILYQKT